MGTDSFIIFLLIGGIAGWLAGLLVKGGGMGILTNIVVGIIGAFIAGIVLPMVGFSFNDGFIGSILNSMIGAVIFLVVLRLLKKA